MKKILGNFKDETINSNYELAIFDSAKELSANLKKTYTSQGIDYNKFNSDYANDNDYSWDKKENNKLIKNPPKEIYEYQNFFLLEKSNGEFALLDGFRRLLWYDAPDTNIMVRIYKQTELSDDKILTLLVYLNHFKFYGGGSYQERGFSLLLNTIFNIDITKFRSAFDAYLSSDEIKSNYGSGLGNSSTKKNNTLKERILHPCFVSDMRFLQKLSEAKCMVNKYFGAFVYSLRKNITTDFNADDFIRLSQENSVLQALMVKYEKVGTRSSAESIKVVNQIMEMYQNIFTTMQGGSVEKSYAELLKDCKDMSAQIKKDKNWTKMTGNQSVYKIERIIEQMIKDGIEPQFKCIIYPNERQHGEEVLPCGILEGLKFLGPERLDATGRTADRVGITYKGYKFKSSNNSGAWNSGKKYTGIWTSSIKGLHHISYDMDLFVNIPKSEIPT